MNFMPVETRDRHAFVERTIEDIGETLSNPEATDYLGPYKDVLAYMLDRLYVPNMHNGEIVLPKNRELDGVSIFALMPGEVLLKPVDSQVLSPIQEDMISDSFSLWGRDDIEADSQIDEINTKLKEGHREVVCPDVRGFVSVSRAAILGRNAIYVARSMSMIGLVMRNDRTQVGVSTTTAHEMRHVYENDTNPVVASQFLQAESDSGELQAYEVTALYGGAAFDMRTSKHRGDKSALDQSYIEVLRRQHELPAQPYVLHDGLAKALDSMKSLHLIHYPATG